jgi:hypothetical protein
MKDINWGNVLSSLWHLALLGAAAYTMTQPKWAWAAPVLQAAGQVSPPPDLHVLTPKTAEQPA